MARLPPADAAVIMLATTIGSLLEDHAHDALSASGRDLGRLAARLERLGGDITALSAAMRVLLRESESIAGLPTGTER